MTRDQNVKTAIHPNIVRPARVCFGFLPTLLLCWGVAAISATGYSVHASANMSEVEAECFEAFYRNNGRYWSATTVGAGDTDFDVIPCLPFVSKDMKTWIGSEPDSGEAVSSVFLFQKAEAGV